MLVFEWPLRCRAERRGWARVKYWVRLVGGAMVVAFSREVRNYGKCGTAELRNRGTAFDTDTRRNARCAGGADGRSLALTPPHTGPLKRGTTSGRIGFPRLFNSKSRLVAGRAFAVICVICVGARVAGPVSVRICVEGSSVVLLFRRSVVP